MPPTEPVDDDAYADDVADDGITAEDPGPPTDPKAVPPDQGDAGEAGAK